MKFERGFAQHVGSRQEQQDAGLVLSNDGHAEQLVLVADGMGGHAGGSIASAQLAETAKRVWAEHKKSPLEPKRLLERIIREGHEAINKAGADKGLTPRSTCAMLLVRDGTAHWAHVGDSRIYRLRDGQVARLTRDHSVVQMLVDLGKVSEEEMGTHPDQNRLTQSLGGDAAPMPDFGNDQIKVHDAFLVCSDGLWEMIPPAEMAAALAAKKLGDDGARHLVERAFDRAKPKSDNITVALLRVGGPPPAGVAQPDEAPTIRLAESARPRSSGGPRWAYAAATVVAIGAAGAAVMGPWGNKGGPDTQPSAVTPKKDSEIRLPGEDKRNAPGQGEKEDKAKESPDKPREGSTDEKKKEPQRSGEGEKGQKDKAPENPNKSPPAQDKAPPGQQEGRTDQPSSPPKADDKAPPPSTPPEKRGDRAAQQPSSDTPASAGPSWLLRHLRPR